VERLQDISEADAKAEGGKPRGESHSVVNGELVTVGERDFRCGFRMLWEHVNGEGSWEQNPYVWVVEFRRVDPTPAAHGGDEDDRVL